MDTVLVDDKKCGNFSECKYCLKTIKLIQHLPIILNTVKPIHEEVM